MNNVIFLCGITILIVLIILLYINFLESEKLKLYKIIEVKNFVSSLKNIDDLKVNDLLIKNIDKIKSNVKLKESIKKLLIDISKDEIYSFSECWDEFAKKITSDINLIHNVEISELMKQLGKCLGSYDKEQKNKLVNELENKINEDVRLIESDFIKKKVINFKYMVISIVLVLVLNM